MQSPLEVHEHGLAVMVAGRNYCRCLLQWMAQEYNMMMTIMLHTANICMQTKYPWSDLQTCYLPLKLRDHVLLSLCPNLLALAVARFRGFCRRCMC